MIGSLFSGIGGLELGLERVGFGPVAWQVERDTFCQRVLTKHWPTVERFDDVRAVGASVLRPVSLICGGFPCQDVSAAGKGEGLAGERSGLWSEFRRIVEELAPPLVVVENVASGARRWLPHVRRDLHLLGYRTRAVALSAFDVGAPHLRRRVFVLAAHPERIELRNEQGGCRWAQRQGPTESCDDGQKRPAAHPDGEGQLQPQGPVADQWRWSRDGGGTWAIEPPVCGVAHGVPRRVDRLRALGNAVVPQCTEIAGRVLAEWAL